MISYSFHLSNKGNSISTINKLCQVSRHNLRAYNSPNYSKEDIVVLRGSPNSILESVKEIYYSEFNDALDAYNQNKRPDRQIKDYLQHVSTSRGDVAAEIIIQVGDKDFWSNIDIDRDKLTQVFDAQISSLERELPSFRIASAVIHYDESSPHVHIIGIPIADGYTKGLSKQVAKTKVFTQNSLLKLQDTMRTDMSTQLTSFYPELKFQLKEKTNGRNKDIPISMMEEFDAMQNALKTMTSDLQIYNEFHNNISISMEDYKEMNQFIIKEDTIKDGLFNSHTVHSVVLECDSQEQAEVLVEDLNNLYNEHLAIEGISKTIEDHKNEIQEANRIIEARDTILAEAQQLANQVKLKQKKALEQINDIYEQLTRDNFIVGFLKGITRFNNLPESFYLTVLDEVREKVITNSWSIGFKGRLAEITTFELLQKYFSDEDDDQPTHSISKEKQKNLQL